MGEEGTRIEAAQDAPVPLFILSFRNRDDLSRLAEEGGWQPIAARRAANAEARFLASGAAVAVVDARGAPEEAHEGVRRLAEATETNAAALLVLIDTLDARELERFYDEGATHFLSDPITGELLASAVRFAARHAERTGGGPRAERRGSVGAGASWRWQPGDRSIELSPALARQAGLGGEDGQRISLLELFRKLDPEGRRAARSAVDRLIASGQPTSFAHRAADGAFRLAHRLRVDPDCQDIVAITETIAPTDRGSSRDPLTGLRDAPAVRAWLADRLGSGADEQPVLAMLIAVSRFDAINGAFGRSTGDTVLQAAARRIERLIDPDGQKRLVARLAGAEFGVFLAPPTGGEEGRFLAGQMIDTIGRPFISGDHVITLGCRIGVAAAEPGDDAATLLRRASAALSEAKVGDTGPIKMFEAGAAGAGARRDRLEIDLRKALDQDQIDILFQPQVSIATGAIVGVEALARWHHPQFGELGAATLFNVAERSDYLAQLSEHVQRKALSAAAAWPEQLGGLRLAVNITAADIVRPSFAEGFARLVERSGFDPARLTVEVTEGELIDDLGAAAALLASLREQGLRVAIDDFGTGYSSLAYLKALPLDYLKIDKRLCEDIAGSPRDRIVIRSVIEMARSLGLTVIAEGVETEEQLGLLAQEGCNLYQGFLCSEPVDSERLVELVSPK